MNPGPDALAICVEAFGLNFFLALLKLKWLASKEQVSCVLSPSNRHY